jgi:hypothetical protein
MIERSITDLEKEYGLKWCKLPNPVPPHRAFTIGFAIGTVIVPVAALIAKYAVLDLFWKFSSVGTFTYYTSLIIVGSMLLGVYSIRDARKCHSYSINFRETVRADLERGIVHEYSGDIETAAFDEIANPEHPPLCVMFVNGDTVQLDVAGQTEFDIHDVPERRFMMVRLPMSELVVFAASNR